MDISNNETHATAQKQNAEHIKQMYGAKDVLPEKAEPYALEFQSISTLKSKARNKRISGRSTMNKTELIMAIRQAR